MKELQDVPWCYKWGEKMECLLAKTVLLLNSCNIRCAPPSLQPLPRRSTAQSVPDVRKSLEPQLEIREQFMASYGPGLVCLLHTLTHTSTQPSCLSGNTLILEFPSLALSKRFGVNKLQLVNWNGGPLVPLLSCTIWLILSFFFSFLCPPPPYSFFLSLYRSSELRLWDLDCGSSLTIRASLQCCVSFCIKCVQWKQNHKTSCS